MKFMQRMQTGQVASVDMFAESMTFGIWSGLWYKLPT